MIINTIVSVILCHAGSSGSRFETAGCESTPQAQGYTCSSSKACSGNGISTIPGSICTADAWQSTGCYAYRQETETDSVQTTATARYVHCLQCQHWQRSLQLKLCIGIPVEHTQIIASAGMLACWSQSQHWQQWVVLTSFSGVICDQQEHSYAPYDDNCQCQAIVGMHVHTMTPGQPDILLDVSLSRKVQSFLFFSSTQWHHRKCCMI